jgi:FtsZ-interacting cell division protein ZipA
VLVILILVIVLVIGGVIFPAVWSSKKTRRTAALDVLDRLLRWRR